MKKKHYMLFVNSMYTLSKELITQVELDKCEEDFMHLIENVRNSGPLWATSAVAFERNIYLLKRAMHGPKGPEQQM